MKRPPRAPAVPAFRQPRRAACLLLALALLPARHAGGAEDPPPAPSPADPPAAGTGVETPEYGEPALRLRLAGLNRLGAKMESFLRRFAAGESTDPSLLDPAAEPPRAVMEEAHGDAQPHRHGQGPGEPPNRLALVTGAFLKIPPGRVGHFLDLDREILFLGFPPTPEGAWPVGAYVPLRHFEELLGVWQRDEVVRHMVTELESGVHRLAYPRYGPFYLAWVEEGGGLAVSGSPALTLFLARQAKALRRTDAPLQPHVRLRLRPAALRAALRQRRKAAAPEPPLPAFMPPQLQALGNLPRALVRSEALAWQRAREAVVDLYFGDESLALDARVHLAPPATDEARDDGSARPGNAPADPSPPAAAAPADPRRPLLALLPENTVAYLRLPDAAAVAGALDSTLAHAWGSPQRQDRLLLELIRKKTLQTVRGAVCCAYLRGAEMSDLPALVVFRTADHASAQAYVAALQPHMQNFMSGRAVRDTVALAFGLRHAAVLEAWKRSLEAGEVGLGKRLDALPWAGESEEEVLLTLGVWPVDLLKAVVGEIIVQTRVHGLPVRHGQRKTEMLDAVDDSPTPAIATLSRNAAGDRLRLVASLPAGAYMDTSRLMQRVVFGWQEMHRRVAGAWLEAFLDRLAARQFRKSLGGPGATGPDSDGE